MIRACNMTYVEKFTKDEEEITKPQDIIVIRYKTETIYNQDGSFTVKRIPKKINLTKKVNESAKLIKVQQAEALKKLAKLEAIMTE